MQYSEEWKSLFPISLVNSPPLLVSDTSLGPLFFNPVPETVNTVLSSSSQGVCPMLLPPPHVSLSRFIESSTMYDDSGAVLRTTCNAIASSFGPQHCSSGSRRLSQNRIEPLRCPNDWVIVFYPTGSNSDTVGFLVLTVKDSNVGIVDFGSNDGVFTCSIQFGHQIVKLAACGLHDFDDVGELDSMGCIGFLVACSMYGAHWFSVRIGGRSPNFKKPVLEYIGCKLFKSCAVVHVCWNPHLLSECVILLESGELFLFDVESSCFKGKRMSIEWNKSAGDGWFSCEFSWHPRILIVANLTAVFLIDFRFGKGQPCCLLQTQMLGMYNVSEEERLVALSKPGNEGFYFTVASTHSLLLCDVRKPLMPVLRWAHNLHKPCYISVLPLSQLRSHPLNETYAGASEMGYAVILGSFWYNEFSLFCYGRPTSAATQSFSSKISNFSDSFYAWEHPSELRLSGHSCGCGSCLLKEELVKDDLPEWIKWQHKKEVVLGFFMLDKDLSSSLLGSVEHGGFTLVRLMSSGKIETQQYHASWKMARTAYHEIPPLSKDSLLCHMGDEKYKFTKRFKYVKLEYLFGHLNDNLTRVLFSKFNNSPVAECENKCSNDFSEFMSEKLKSFGCAPPILHLSTSDIFSDVNMPSSLYEIVSRLMWISLPMSSLEMAFSQYRSGALEFPSIPDQSQAPPFFLKSPSHNLNIRRRKNSCGIQFVGPVVPLHVLLVLYEISRYGHSFITQLNDYSPETLIARKCKPVMCLARELGISKDQDKEKTVSLGDDKDDSWVDSSNPSSLYLYEPSAFSTIDSPCLDGEDSQDSLQERKTFISKVTKLNSLEDSEAPKLFDGLCPVKLKFHSDDQAFVGEELKAYQFLKKQFSDWQHGFLPCQELF
ncbi:uncharacterized protein LOC141602304 [Silene latifolia]|uniref:uncharacterized protein LOC141602304 n=1 Tax=Silene latifolia TaxID=37657 RepID=UPI003D78195B